MTLPRVTLGDFIIYKVAHAEGNGFTTQLGKVINILEDAESSRIQVEQYSEDLEAGGDEDIVEMDSLVCNLFSTPMIGAVYGKFIKDAPAKVNLDGHQVFIHFPKEITERVTEPYINALIDGFKSLEAFKENFCDKAYEIHIREGETHKSSYKKSKKDLDALLNLEIRFAAPETTINALTNAFSQYVWKTGSKENKSDWLRVFSDELVFEKLINTAFTEKFILFLTGEAKQDDLEPEDEIMCKVLVKEIKKVKCLSLKELRIMVEVIGEDFVINNILPEVINSVRLKNSVRITPLQGMTALKKFSSELTGFVISNRVDSSFEMPLKLFLD